MRRHPVREIGQQISMLCLKQAASLRCLQPILKLAQVAAIAVERVARKPVLQPQRIAEFVEQIICHVRALFRAAAAIA